MIDFRERVGRILNHAKKNFGEPCILYPQAGGQYPITGIFDNDYQAVHPDTEQVISGTEPVLGVNLFDLSFEINIGDQIQVRNLRYKINDKRPDGQGGASLFLHRVNHEQKVFKKKSN